MLISKFDLKGQVSVIRFMNGECLIDSFDVVFLFRRVNFSLFIVFCLVSFVFWSYSALCYSYVIPTRFQFLFEQFFQFLYSVLVQQAGIAGGVFFPFLVATFITIFLANFLGLIPYSYTLTSSLFIPFSLALSFNLGFLIWGFYIHGLAYLGFFVLKGVPSLLKPLLVLIEVMSYLIRSFSLSLRLFANMMAGHALLQILASFVQVFLLSFSLFVFFGLNTFFSGFCLYLY
jgi:F-type H+-transporting ATPase subunit a